MSSPSDTELHAGAPFRELLK